MPLFVVGARVMATKEGLFWRMRKAWVVLFGLALMTVAAPDTVAQFGNSPFGGNPPTPCLLCLPVEIV